MSAVATGWQGVLAAIKGSWPEGVDARPWLRERACRAAAGRPEPEVRASAFAAVLDHAAPRAYPGDRILGSRHAFRLPARPEGADDAAIAAAAAAQAARGQRDFGSGWDHTLADWPTLLAEGVGGTLARIRRSEAVHAGAGERAVLAGMRLAVEAFGRFVAAHAAVAGEAEDAARLRRLAARPPATFHDAVQLVWLVHIAFTGEGRYANALGRVDQYLFPFYERDLAAGRLDRAGALELLCHLWAHVHELGEVTNICIGGLRPDGGDGTNELSLLCLEATALVGSPHTNLSARFHDGTPAAFHRAAFACIRTGIGFPAIFNDEVLVPGLVGIGIPPEVARDHCMVGCIETMLAGRQPAWSDSRFNAPAFLLAALRRLALEPAPDWPRLQELFVAELREGLRRHAERVNAHIASVPAGRVPDPFLSALTRDCIGRARDVNGGGAEFPRFHGIAVMGLGTLADGLCAVKTLVLEERRITLDRLLAALDADFAGEEALRQELLTRAPKYGNGDPRVDDLAAWVVETVAGACADLRTPDGGRHVALMAANTNNIAAGAELGATPDGRRARAPLSDAASPSFGRDRLGPTAVLHSVSRPDYRRILGGSVINMKFEPAFFEGPEGPERFGAFTSYFVRSRIPELQFNFSGRERLLAARARPEEHGDLVVRVSGFSAYFVHLAPEVQDDILARTAHGA